MCNTSVPDGICFSDPTRKKTTPLIPLFSWKLESLDGRAFGMFKWPWGKAGKISPLFPQFLSLIPFRLFLQSRKKVKKMNFVLGGVQNGPPKKKNDSAFPPKQTLALNLIPPFHPCLVIIINLYSTLA